MMRAAVVLGPNRTPLYGEFDEPTPQDGLTVLRVTASALSNATRAASGDLRMDLTEVPLADVEKAWTADPDGSRVVLTI